MLSIDDISSDFGMQDINEQHPAGSSIRYDDDFEFLEDEYAKQGALIDRGQLDWKKIIQVSLNLLNSKSRDIKVSCYLNRALYECYGFSGLAKGLLVNHNIISCYWDSLYPLKPRARANAYEWMTSKMEPLLQGYSILPAHISIEFIDDLELCFTTIRLIEDYLNNKLAENAPALGNMRRTLSDLLESAKLQFKENVIEPDIPEKALEPSKNIDNRANTVSITEQKHSANPTGKHSEQGLNTHNTANTNDLYPKNSLVISGIDEQSSDKERTKVLKQCQDALRTMALLNINKNLDSPSAYAMNRYSTWININQLPIHTDNITPLKPVPVDKRNRCFELFKNAQYQELIPIIEASFSRAPFWLDVHRLVSQSLEILGFSESSRQVNAYLGIFLKRFPEIIDLKFSDNSAFADNQTKAWIKKQISGEQNTSLSSSVIATESEQQYKEIYDQAGQFAQQQKIKEAIACFQKQIQQTQSTKQKIYWKYYLAQFCFENNQEQLSLSILHDIDGFIQKNNLQYWEPDLARNVTCLLYQNLKNSLKNSADYQHYPADSTQLDNADNSASSGSNSNSSIGNSSTLIQTELAQLYSRLCQMDPVLALEIS